MPAPPLQTKLISLAVAVAAVVGVGTAGYIAIEGWSAFDALYMTMITLATVGYGETHELSTQGRAFTMVLIPLGVGVLAYAVSNLTAFLVEGELTDVLRRSRMQGKIASLRGHHIVCGHGHSGKVIEDELRRTGRDVVVVESNEARVRALVEAGVLAVQGDATRDETLRRAGIDHAAGLFAALGTDPDNAFVVLTARGLRSDLRIVAEQIEEGVDDALRRSGADAVVRPSQIGGMRMASVMVRPAVVGFLDEMLRKEDHPVRIEEIPVGAGAAAAGRPVGSLRGEDRAAGLILGLKVGGEYLFNPPADRAVAAGDVVVVMGTREQQETLRRRIAG